MVNTDEIIKYYDSSDLAQEMMIKRSLKFIEQYGRSPNFNNINLVLTAYNIYRLLTKTPLFEQYNHQVSIAKEYIKHCNIYFLSLNDNSITLAHNTPCKEYQENYWYLFNDTKRYNIINNNTFKKIIQTFNPNISTLLKYSQIVNTYSREITNYIIKRTDFVFFILDYFYTYNKENRKQFTIPKELSVKTLLWFINKELSKNNVDYQHLKLIENSTSIDLCIPDKMKVKAKKYRQKIENEILSNSSTIISNMEIIFKNAIDLINTDCQPPNLTITIDQKWIDENTQNDYLFANLFIFLFICDKNYRAKFIAHKTQATTLEEIFDKPLGTNDYFQPFNSKLQESLAQLFIISYSQILLKQNKKIEDLLEWFYTEYIANEFNVYNFTFNSSSDNSTFLEKCRNLCSEIDSVLKQYQLYYENNEIDRELLEINSKPLLFSQLKSYDKNKFAYIVDMKYKDSMYQIFSDQSSLNLITKLLNTNKSFISELLNPSLDLCLSDFDNIQQNIIKKLQYQKLITLNSNEKIIANPLSIKALDDFYKNSCICNKIYQKHLNSLNVQCNYTNSLFSTPEIDYLNFILNKKQFANGLDLRNKYIHGSQSRNKSDHSHDYYLLLMIHCFIALKIYDELANRKPQYSSNS